MNEANNAAVFKASWAEELYNLATTLRAGLWLGIFANTCIFSYFFGVFGLPAVLLGLGLCITSSMAFLINDFLDKEIDASNGADRWKATAATYLVVALALAISNLLTLAYLFSHAPLDVALAYLSVVSGVVLYSLIFDKLPYLKNLTAAIIALSPVWIVGILAEFDHRDDTISYFAFFCGSLLLFLIAREIRFDEFDKTGDLKGGRMTLAHIVSSKVLFVFEGSVVVAGTIGLIVISIFMNTNALMQFLGVVISASLGAANLAPLLFKDKAKYYKTTRLGMYLLPFLGFVLFV